MTREETVKIIRIMVDSYPNYKPNNLSETVDVWTMMLEEYTYQQVSLALKTYILSDEKGFAPAIGQIVANIQKITTPKEINEMEAWALVSKAIRNSTYNFNAEYDKLPAVVQKAVGLPKQLQIWAMDENYNEQVVSSNFIKCYRTEVNRKSEYDKLPAEVKNLIDTVNIKPANMISCDDKKETLIDKPIGIGYTEDIGEQIKNLERQLRIKG